MSAIFVTFTGPFPGREQKALEMWMENNAFWATFVTEGRVSPPEQFWSPATEKGYFIVKGPREELLRIHDMPEARAMTATCMLNLMDYTEELVLADDEVTELYTTYGGVLTTV